MDKPQRRTVRYSGYDYSMHGAYFITVCAERHRPFFGTIENNQMESNWVGRIVEREWLRVAQLRDNVLLDEFVVMPNHFHAVVIIHPDRTNADVTHADAASQTRTFGKPQAGSLAMIVGDDCWWFQICRDARCEQKTRTPPSSAGEGVAKPFLRPHYPR